MGAIEETRQVLQDFLAPEIRSIVARLDAVDKRLEGLEKQIGDVERRADRRHDEVMAAIRQVIDWNSVPQRLAKLESKSQELTHQ